MILDRFRSHVERICFGDATNKQPVHRIYFAMSGASGEILKSLTSARGNVVVHSFSKTDSKASSQNS